MRLSGMIRESCVCCGQMRALCLFRLYHQTDCGSAFIVDGDFRKGRGADQIQADRGEKAARDGDCFDRLIDGACTDSLQFRDALLPDDACQCAGDHVGIGF